MKTGNVHGDLTTGETCLSLRRVGGILIVMDAMLHRGVVLMKFSNIVAVGFAIAFLGSFALHAGGALAFQEQNSGQSPAVSQSSGKVIDQQGGAAVEFGSGSVQTRSESGTEVRIPGLGKLGVLPKMDFGLELLYGASEGKAVEPPQNPAANDDDLRIRGTVKHRF